MSHWVEQILGYRSLQQYSAKRQEQAHKPNLNDGWNASNHKLNYLPQVITFQCRILCLEIRQFNLQTFPQRQENSAAPCKILLCGADLAAPLSSQSSAKHEFMGPQNHLHGKHPDGRSNDFRALLDNSQDATHHVPIYNGTREFIKQLCCNQTYISDEQLHAMELCIYHGIQVQLEGEEIERISQMCQCAGSQSWRGGNWQMTGCG